MLASVQVKSTCRTGVVLWKQGRKEEGKGRKRGGERESKKGKEWKGIEEPQIGKIM